MPRTLLCLLLLLCATSASVAQDSKPLLLRRPTLSRTQVAFVYGGDIWVAPRDGGEAHRLTAGAGIETDPCFSPDGTQIAFTGEYDGNVDVYVVPADGGVPRRLTYHPAADTVVGWTPDGTRVLFRSSRESYTFFERLYTIPASGGAEVMTEVPLPRAEGASYSPDGTHLAYVPNMQWQAAWKRYRGGQTTPIWIADLSDSSVEKLPRENSNDFNPMWVGQTIYFLSDRNGPVTLFAYDTATKAVRQVVENSGFDIKSASAGPGAIAYEQFGTIYLYDLNSRSSKRLDISVAGDLPEVRPHFEKIAPRRINNAAISPSGVRAAFEARGEILTVPAEKGDVRDITNTVAAAERDPAWSPDGKWVAYFSDESGEYALHLRDQSGMGEARRIDLGQPPSFFYSPRWSPDSKRIAYTDKRMNVWYVDLDRPVPVRVDSDIYELPFHTLDPAWSPDGKWIAYTKQLANHLHAVFLYSLEQKKSYQVTDGMSDARYPVFDHSGKYLYFAASTDLGQANSWLEMSSINRPFTRSVYMIVLDKSLPSPLAPESDDEKVAAETTPSPTPSLDASQTPTAEAVQQPPADAKAQGAAKSAQKKLPTVRVDLEQIGQRVLALPLPARNYAGLVTGKDGVLFVAEAPPVVTGEEDGVPVTVEKFDLSTRKADRFLEGVTALDVSFNGEKVLFQRGPQWFIAGTAQPPKPGEGALRLDDLTVQVDPRAEWRQMYREVWRIERDFFYDPNHHGLDIKAAEAKYEPYLERLASRDDLNYLFEEMLGELTVGHVFVNGGERPDVKRVGVGLLGADYDVDRGRYRFARVYNGENWNPQLRAPLTQPGVNVRAGEYLLAVRGREIHATDNVYQFFESAAGKSVAIRVGPNPDGTGSREVTVVPVASERGLRQLAWIEDNRRKVDQLSGGRVAYVYLPNTAGAGFTNFNRYFFSQTDKQAVIIDERYNSGGDIADYIIDALRRPPMSRVTTREGEDYSYPVGSIYGPKVMLINEMAGSGGDALPWYFRKANLGPLVGKKTWGGLVGIYDYPELMDGGQITAPRIAIYGLKGEWEVENHGIAPDVEVEYDPKLVRQGHDPQLEKAVEVALDLLARNPPQQFKKPVYPNYHNGSTSSETGNHRRK
ncbi:MAG TPA: PDZ domain-containing protein [Pyrinomonadaceae bacterium]|nr:PDZ domain-containing protein [Pyrinomonadaceae bacterium]